MLKMIDRACIAKGPYSDGPFALFVELFGTINRIAIVRRKGVGFTTFVVTWQRLRRLRYELSRTVDGRLKATSIAEV